MEEDGEKARAMRRKGAIGKVLMALGAGAILQSCHSEIQNSPKAGAPVLETPGDGAAVSGGAFTGAAPALEPGFVVDKAGALTPESHTALTNEIAALRAATDGGQMGVVFLTTLSGIPIEDAALRIARSWQLGREGVDDGALLLVATRDREVRLEVGLGWEGAMPDSVAGDVIRAISPELKASQWGEAALEAVRQVRAAVLGEPAPRRKSGNTSGDGASPAMPLGMFSLFVGFALWDSSRPKKRKPNGGDAGRGNAGGGGFAPFPPSGRTFGGGHHFGGGGRFGGGGASGRF